MFQLFVVVMISFNFLINLAEAQFLPPPGSPEEQIYSLRKPLVFNAKLAGPSSLTASSSFNRATHRHLQHETDARPPGRCPLAVDLVFTVLFAVELVLNLYVNWWRPFISSGWSVFDLIVVSTSLLAAALPAIPAVNVLRLVRIFRIFRLFQWFRSLKIIINAVTAAILPVFSSFIVLFLVRRPSPNPHLQSLSAQLEDDALMQSRPLPHWQPTLQFMLIVRPPVVLQEPEISLILVM